MNKIFMLPLLQFHPINYGDVLVNILFHRMIFDKIAGKAKYFHKIYIYLQIYNISTIVI